MLDDLRPGAGNWKRAGIEAAYNCIVRESIVDLSRNDETAIRAQYEKFRPALDALRKAWPWLDKPNQYDLRPDGPPEVPSAADFLAAMRDADGHLVNALTRIDELEAALRRLMSCNSIDAEWDSAIVNARNTLKGSR